MELKQVTAAIPYFLRIEFTPDVQSHSTTTFSGTKNIPSSLLSTDSQSTQLIQ